MKVKSTGKSTKAQEKRMHTLGRNNTNYDKLFWKKNVICNRKKCFTYKTGRRLLNLCSLAVCQKPITQSLFFGT
jgi:hypothetical protein